MAAASFILLSHSREELEKQEAVRREKETLQKIDQEHKKLTARASRLNYIELKNAIGDLTPLHYPEHSENRASEFDIPDNNLLLKVHSHKTLDKKQKNELLGYLLVFKNYGYANLALQSPIVDHFVNDYICLSATYQKFCVNNYHAKLEAMIWEKFCEMPDSGMQLLKDCIIPSRCSRRLLAYTEFWMKQLNDPTLIINLFQKIKAIYSNTVWQNIKNIRKIVDFRLLEIAAHREGLAPVENKKSDPTYQFLKSHHHHHCRFFHCGNTHKDGLDIYKQLQKDQTEGRKMMEEEKTYFRPKRI